MHHSLTLAADGSIVSWGFEGPDGRVSNTPTGNGFTAIAGGYAHSVALVLVPEPTSALLQVAVLLTLLGMRRRVR